MNLTLTQRLSLVFSALLLACCGASAWLQIRSSDLHEKEVVQSLSRDVANHIAHRTTLMDANGLRPDAVRQLFGQLMLVNPSVEVYLLDNQGRIKGDDAPEGHVKREQVDLAPIRQFIAGDALPILGDDPRSLDGKKVFSAAPLQLSGQQPSGYIYVVLLGEAHDALAARVAASSVLRTTLWSMALVALFGLLAGLTAFGLITRPLRRLTDAMRRFDANGEPDTQPVVPHSAPAGQRDEIAVLETAFAQMANRIGDQWRALSRQDQQRRELIANISHDLRTPLTSLHGYLETLSLKADTLGETERKRYLAIALAQSVKVGRLAQALFELARLEHGNVQPALEQFSLVDLVQDVFQKFELPAEARHIQLRASIPPRLPTVCADLGMIERVLTNLLDNAIRHTPADGEIDVDLAHKDGKVSITVSDTGPGIPAEQREGLFERPFSSGGAHRGGGLGLLIVQRMLQLHHSQIRIIERAGPGTTFCFELPTTGKPAVAGIPS
ncbi:Adaptive-response sensory-kinase SasA [Paraburkholderia domus]|uniref:histidine kinase n=1 Tax=Paraburkholderia domus TaxID=2793075 RepID=A0A9N8QY13_9BURK|nr:HAMP domain-containing sensor histidine kinase [Paraburkholderia domus]MBK5048918.1 HAMP domain-containing histidine kinase [Burkholderia sp. R-70006]MBK5061371.1 HAMP domain-containing histidine kinase [Burkholderia sp. R-70199]MBK5086413.1 HAMP domain-containing histidine kinase [Burkholderia sp. R-69927]MBK5120308.1 HAMP domain-containing histidine kinase [Burkholderia sp. R-69980]MBK5165749.1 HAMP domain-containing histidine kinase [Burkholderia sp. R-70211]MBK5179978.1 HAMP domain-con